MKEWVSSWIIDPDRFARLNIYGTWFWIAMVPVAIATGWINSIAFISAVSIYALAGFHLSTYAAARTEILQSDADRQLHELVKRLQKLDPDHPREDADVPDHRN